MLNDLLNSLGISGQELVKYVLAAVLAYFGLGGKVPKSVPFVGGEKKPDDHAELDALNKIRARADRSKCPMFLEAVHDVEVSFFNHGTPEDVK